MFSIRINKEDRCAKCGGKVTRGMNLRGLKGNYCYDCRQKPEARKSIAFDELSKVKLDNFIIFDTETTGLHDKGSLVRFVTIGIIDQDGTVLVDRLINPGISIPEGSSAVHGIYDDDVKDAPHFPDIHKEIFDAMNGQNWLAYNIDYDVRVLKNMCDIYKLPMPSAKVILDIMPYYAFMYGEIKKFNGKFEYKYQKLSAARERLNLNVFGGADHGAVADTQTTLELYRHLISK